MFSNVFKNISDGLKIGLISAYFSKRQSRHDTKPGSQAIYDQGLIKQF